MDRWLSTHLCTELSHWINLVGFLSVPLERRSHFKHLSNKLSTFNRDLSEKAYPSSSERLDVRARRVVIRIELLGAPRPYGFVSVA
jgi:hypothetical protein